MAREFGMHPADWLGMPETKAAYCWTVWALRLLHAENEARKQAARA